jgi:hypothetical protein
MPPQFVRCITSNLIATVVTVDYWGGHAATKTFRSANSATASNTTVPNLQGADVSFDYRAGPKSRP